MMQHREFSVILNDNSSYKVHFTDWGNGEAKKTLVCVHGLTRNCRDFDYLASELSSNYGYRVLSIDMPGRGRSEYLPNWEMYVYENYCLVILSILEQLNLTSIDYLGTSMGGILALHLAQNRPELFNKLILNDVGTFLPKESIAKIVRYVRVYPIFTDLEHAKSYLKVKLAHFGIKLEENWDYITKHSIHLNHKDELVLDYDFAITEVLFAYSKEVMDDIDYSPLWSGANFKKLLLIRGSKSEVLLRSTALEMVAAKDNAKLIEFDGVGHTPCLMEKDQIKAIINWLV
jgi:pimeloyl-ACP methyl ester carboxylesterase